MKSSSHHLSHSEIGGADPWSTVIRKRHSDASWSCTLYSAASSWLMLFASERRHNFLTPPILICRLLRRHFARKMARDYLSQVGSLFPRFYHRLACSIVLGCDRCAFGVELV